MFIILPHGQPLNVFRGCACVYVNSMFFLSHRQFLLAACTSFYVLGWNSSPSSTAVLATSSSPSASTKSWIRVLMTRPGSLHGTVGQHCALVLFWLLQPGIVPFKVL